MDKKVFRRVSSRAMKVRKVTKKGSLLKYRAKGWGKGTENTSKNIDLILYGD